MNNNLHRRQFLKTAAAATTTLATGLNSHLVNAQASTAQEAALPICVFEKFLQDLSYDELADKIAELGCVGIEATVRNRGHVLPERVEEDLPKLVEALEKRDLKVTVMASDVFSLEQPLSEKVLRTAAGLGIQTYRLGPYRYDKKIPLMEQLETIKPQFKELAALNGELGMTGLYQNHSGSRYMGATLWDLHYLIKDIPAEQLGNAFDIRHAAIEAGLSWPTLYRLMKPHIGAIFVKDFDWDGLKAKHVPLGQGRVDPKFFKMLKDDNFSGPYSLHVEYLPKEGTQANIDAIRRDVDVLRDWLK